LRVLREAGRGAVDEDLIFSTILAQRKLVDEASRTTKAMRRDAARRPKSSPAKSIEVAGNAEPPAAADKPLVLPYFEVEEWDE
jgi:putative transposase